MQRRTFFKSALAAIVPLLPHSWVDKLAAASPQPEAPDPELIAFKEIARVVLPGTLGAAKQEEVAGQFAQWVRGYKEGAEMNSGYGFTHLENLPPSPARHYPEQIAALEKAAAARGGAFAALDAAGKRAVIEEALLAAKVDRVPLRPDGKHVASDLLSFYFFSSEGQDFLYNAQIRREDCRGMKSAMARPAPWEA